MPKPVLATQAGQDPESSTHCGTFLQQLHHQRDFRVWRMIVWIGDDRRVWMARSVVGSMRVQPDRIPQSFVYRPLHPPEGGMVRVVTNVGRLRRADNVVYGSHPD